MSQIQLPVVIALVFDDEGRILLSKRNEPNLLDAHGKWQHVGGKVEWGESPEQAVIRETKEETGLDVEIVRMLPKILINYWETTDGEERKVFLMSYECRLVGGELRTGTHDHEISDLKFVPLDEVKNYDVLKGTREIMQLLNP